MDIYPSLLRLDLALSSDEKKLLNDIIIDEETRITTSYVEIENTEKLLRSLRTQREEHAAQAKIFQGLLPSISRIPVELLKEIFHQYYLIQSDENHDYDALDAALLLCAVCQRWREVSISLPELWQSLSLTNASPRRQSWIIQEPVDLWLSRAKVCYPVALTLRSPQGLVASAEQRMLPASMIQKYGSIIDSLTIMSTHPDDAVERSSDMSFIEAVVPSGSTLADLSPLPLLEHLVLITAYYGDEVVTDGLPNLATMPFSWAQLTSLTIRLKCPRLLVNQAAEIMSLCPKLEYCQMCLKTPILSASATPSPLITRKTLTDLQALYLYIFFQSESPDDIDSPISVFFDSFTLPCLKDLNIIFTGFVVDDNGTAAAMNVDQRFTEFKNRSSLDLETFATRGLKDHISPRVLVDFLVDMPSLKTIRGGGTFGYCSETFISTLTVRPGQVQTLAPGLRDLLIGAPPANMSPDLLGLLLDMVESRCRRADETELETSDPGRVYLEHVHLPLRMPNPETWQENEEVKRRVDACHARGLQRFTIC